MHRSGTESRLARQMQCSRAQRRGLQRGGRVVRTLIVMSMVWMIAISSMGPRSALQPIARADLNVTEGTVETSKGRLLIDVPAMRAVLRMSTTQSIEVHFTYLGPAENPGKLASGEVRRQFGVKLKAQDACNVVYVMWRET